MKKKNGILLFIVLSVLLVGIGWSINRKNSQENIGNHLTGGYGSHLQSLDCTVESVKDMNVFVTANEDSYEPETFKKGDKIKLNFASMDTPLDPKNFNLSNGQRIELTYLTMDESSKIREVSMRYPSNIKINEQYIFTY